MDFSAIDVETANGDISSICAIGVVVFRDSCATQEYFTLIDPQTYFDPMNIAVHGITEQDVRGAPTFADAYTQFRHLLAQKTVVHHTHFDRVAVHRACESHDLALLECRWLDTARVCRRVWSEFARSGFGLASMCGLLEIRLDHHNALSDAKAAGEILVSAMRQAELDLESVFARVALPISGGAKSYPKSIARSGNPDGDLFGEVVVFTGALAIPRKEAAELAAGAGCEVANNVTKKTTILVVGDSDVARFAGHEKSSKHRRAEALSAEGHPIRILRETDFRLLVGNELV